jgi:pyrimidine-nucleoside phosphorylase
MLISESVLVSLTLSLYLVVNRACGKSMFTPVEVIRTKRDGGILAPDAIDAFVAGATNGSWTDYQLSAMLMAIFLKGMTPHETALLTRSMTDSGERIDLSDIPGPKIDKHSTGGVGDKTSLILAPLAAVCGVIVPMMSGRGLGHTGGTLDKLESIPGFSVGLSLAEFKAALRKNGLGMIGQSDRIVPADKILYALRDVTSTVESIPLITASILSKKIAEGISGLVLDVKIGRGGFMKTLQHGQALARSLVNVATENGLRCRAVLTAMDEPLGGEVGNANEVRECIETLKGIGPYDLEMLSVLLAARMVRLAGLEPTDDQAVTRVKKVLSSGLGLERFRAMVEQQGGDPRICDDPQRLPQAPNFVVVTADRDGYISHVDAELIGRAAVQLGAGRQTVSNSVDHTVGISVKVKTGQPVHSGDPVFKVGYRDERTLAHALPLVRQSFEIIETPPPSPRLVIEEIAT